MIPDNCQRSATRLPVQCPVYYSNGEFHASGVVENLTSAGGRVRGTEPVRKGMELVVFLIPPAPQTALLIRRATVRWTNGAAFGIALIDLPSETQSELARMAVSQIPGLWASLN